ncbi:MAG: alpha-amylase family glycosyl hydrolase [Nostoc sp. DedVER02]|uniref:alpha-amylase family glycosyl hydrolase n=1 Tax=unclassified Nostoc TaxID=2593658 RepID=UPI002AD23DCA|nr:MULTISPECIES: alpha-amylase family glycosyl hydrolase [unclassified Nostoc]MDZ7988886.1 alpha-amylase family glycosyl hydrolase [Nostoc sp. DedVER02]MDZ8112499.1 alpha-amylase family glycosyl hydrolase [Nostoc sp. DedVER01b]
MPIDLLTRKKTHFVLWRVGASELAPTLYIGNTTPESPDRLAQFREIPLRQSAEFPELWEVSAQESGLVEGQVYFYWFKVRNSDPYSSANINQILYCTDPTATTVDRRFPAPTPSESGGVNSFDPASVVLYQNGTLIPCDPQGQTVNWEGDAPLDTLPTNNQLVIYELPTRWTKINSNGLIEEGVGTFRDVLALLIPEAIAPTFPMITALKNRAHLVELGINALELLPPEDSDDNLNWGYGTANYFAADFDLGRPDSQSAPTASTDLANLIKACHQQGLRFFVDVVMAFSRNNPYHNVNFLEFYIKWASGDPEQGSRDGFGGDLFKYNYWVEGYNPITGQKSWLVPAREYLKVHIAHWLEYYRVDGLRLDSVNNIANYDFLQEFKDFARTLWDKRGGSGDRFLVVGEELSVPLSLIQQNRLDGLWNEKFKQIIRQVILGKNAWDEPSFEWSIRKLIDCRNLGFTDGSQAVNYITSHDVGGYGNERFFSYLVSNGIADTEPRIKLAFVSLLTSVGIPMILAGDEFADRQDLPTTDDHKQIDPVNYSRVKDDWRQRIFQYVARLVRLRKTYEALAVNDTKFIHVDFNDGKRVLVWQRGNKADRLVVVVANFSDYGTPPGSEYRVPNWPATPIGKQWKEITQERIVPSEWVGREGIFPWEAKVYALV